MKPILEALYKELTEAYNSSTDPDVKNHLAQSITPIGIEIELWDDNNKTKGYLKEVEATIADARKKLQEALGGATTMRSEDLTLIKPKP